MMRMHVMNFVKHYRLATVESKYIIALLDFQGYKILTSTLSEKKTIS